MIKEGRTGDVPLEILVVGSCRIGFASEKQDRGIVNANVAVVQFGEQFIRFYKNAISMHPFNSFVSM